MSRMIRHSTVIAAFIAIVFLSSGHVQASNLTTYKGKFPDGAKYLIEVPSNWNGTLVLYSHGYVIPGASNPAEDVGDPVTGAYLLKNGYALAGSSYATTGWAIQQALPDQIKVLDTFNTLVGKPKRTIAWGHSLGGMVTAGLIQTHPARFDAALPMCGVVAGGVGTWNQALDSAFAFATLLGSGSGLQLVNITDPNQNITTAETILNAAQNTAQGQARIALSAALADTPGWFDPLSPEPAPSDYATQQANQFLWLQQIDFPFAFYLRAELESRAKGNPSWNTAVDYQKQLNKSVDSAEVKALYQAASLNLDTDLQTLSQTARVMANPPSVTYLKHNIIFNGQIHIPVLTLHTKGDGLVEVENENAYKDVVDDENNGNFLRQIFVHRAGHCAFTPAETIVAFNALIDRLNTSNWPTLDSTKLNKQARALGPTFNVLFVNGQKVPDPPAYFKFAPAAFLRPLDAGRKILPLNFACQVPTNGCRSGSVLWG
jgi:pimeloyl-ACP methyl ester carboxylesterase